MEFTPSQTAKTLSIHLKFVLCLDVAGHCLNPNYKEKQALRFGCIWINSFHFGQTATFLQKKCLVFCWVFLRPNQSLLTIKHCNLVIVLQITLDLFFALLYIRLRSSRAPNPASFQGLPPPKYLIQTINSEKPDNDRDELNQVCWKRQTSKTAWIGDLKDPCSICTLRDHHSD